MNRIIIKKNHLYGVINQSGEIIIEPFYEEMNKFSNGMAAVYKNKKWGYIDEEGYEIIDFLYHGAKDFSIHGLAAVKVSEKSGSWVLVKTNGQLLDKNNNNDYYFIDEFNPEGYTKVEIAGGYQIIDIEGNPINDEVYKSLKYVPKQNIFIADISGKGCFINTKREILIEVKEAYDKVYYSSNGLCPVSKDGKYGYINEKGELVISLKYKEAYEFSDNGLAFVVCENGLGGYINKKDEFVIDPTFESGSTFKFNFAAVSKENEYIFIYANGNKAIDHTFKYAGGFANCGLAKTELFDGRQGLVRPDSSIAITLYKECELSEFVGNSEVTKFRVNGKEALINSDGEIITGLNYDDIIISSNSKLNPFLRNGLWGYMNDEGDEVTANIYEFASEITEDNAVLIAAYNPIDDKVEKLYMNNQNQSTVLSNRSFKNNYSKIFEFKDGVAFAIKKDKKIILNAYGQEIINEDFDLSVKNNNLIIDTKEKEPEEVIETYEFKDEIEVEVEDTIYEITIRFKEKMTKEKISKRIKEIFHSDDILKYTILDTKKSIVKVLWEMPIWADIADMNVSMYYLLDDGRLGEYDYKRVRLK